MNVNQKKYTHKVKVSTLRILEKNGFNYLRTEKITGVSRSTIKKWEAQYGAEVFSGKSPVKVAFKKIDVEMKRNDLKIIKQYYDARRLTLARINELVPDENRLESLGNLLRTIFSEITLLNDQEKKELKPETNVLPIINQKIEEMNRVHQPPGIMDSIDIGDDEDKYETK
jgi:hypothetical protein